MCEDEFNELIVCCREVLPELCDLCFEIGGLLVELELHSCAGPIWGYGARTDTKCVIDG